MTKKLIGKHNRNVLLIAGFGAFLALIIWVEVASIPKERIESTVKLNQAIYGGQPYTPSR